MKKEKMDISQDNTSKMSTQWLNQSEGLYSMYLHDLAMVYKYSSEAPQSKVTTDLAINYLQTQNNFIKLLQFLNGNKKSDGSEAVQEYKKKIDSMNQKLDEMEVKIINQYHENKTESLKNIIILRIIEKEIQVYKKVRREFQRIIEGDSNELNKENDPFEGIILYKDNDIKTSELGIIRDKMKEKGLQVKNCKIHAQYDEALKTRDHLRMEVENLIVRQVDFQSTIKLQEQRLQDINKITEKEEEISKLKNQIKEKEFKVQRILKKINTIENSEKVNERDRESQAGAPVLNHFELYTEEPLPKKKDNIIRKIQISKVKDKQYLLQFGAYLIILFYFIVFAS